MVSERNNSKKEVEFSDDELQLLSQAALDYKAIYKFNAETPKEQIYLWYFNERISRRKRKVFRQGKNEEKRVAAKFKSIQSGFKKAIDCLKKVVAVMWLLLLSIIVTICGAVTSFYKYIK